jgi:hypothetical protein
MKRSPGPLFLATKIRGFAVTIHNPNALIPIAATALPAGLLALDIERAADFAQAEKADATKRAYRSDFALFRGLVRRPGRERTTGHA